MKELPSYNNIIIKRAEKKNASEITKVLLSSWLYAYPNETYQISESEIREKFGDVEEKTAGIGNFLESIQDRSDVNYLIAEVNHKVTGFIYAFRPQTQLLYINALYVDPDFHRTGIGSSLLSKLISLNQNISQISVDVVSYNTHAISFYEKKGFLYQCQSKTPFGHFPNGKTVPETHMVKSLSIQS
ncbi:MAG: GNAT family N-acetyltransferase [Candidatus Levybacteria bacterium]|nr:GNAT family N-acetyltransferase [Candidatus Levybacteria bacterium]